MSANGYLEFEKPIAELEARVAELKKLSVQGNIDLSEEIDNLERKALQLRKQIYGSLSRWQRVQMARHPGRPFTNDYIRLIIKDFIELHGDRLYRDDPAIVGGIGFLGGYPVTVIGHQKGRDTKENIRTNFGMPYPEGYRKALRLMRQAEKFGRPIICLIDTPAAYPGVGAEERGQAEAIAHNLREMFNLKVPVVVAVTGEGGSGGALGIGVGNRVLMMENAIYSVIPPESCAAIIWRDGSKAREAAEALKLTAQDLLQLGVVDEIIPEPVGGAHRNHLEAAKALKDSIVRHLRELSRLSPDELVEQRYAKFRAMGEFMEVADEGAASSVSDGLREAARETQAIPRHEMKLAHEG